MNTKALQLASCFALPPNSLGYCGKGTASAKFLNCIINGKCSGVKSELSEFIVFNPYLETISKITNLGKFSYKVVEAYYLGNNELKKANAKHYNLLLKNFSKQGVPPWLIDELRKNKPKKFIPTHLFQVLHVGVGKASGAVPYNMETINNCMIRWGKVEKISRTNLTINLNSLKKEKGYYILTFIRNNFTYRNDMLPNLKREDTVAVHWKQVIKKLTANEVKKLEFWTKNVLNGLKS